MVPFFLPQHALLSLKTCDCRSRKRSVIEDPCIKWTCKINKGPSERKTQIFVAHWEACTLTEKHYALHANVVCIFSCLVLVHSGLKFIHKFLPNNFGLITVKNIELHPRSVCSTTACSKFGILRRYRLHLSTKRCHWHV